MRKTKHFPNPHFFPGSTSFLHSHLRYLPTPCGAGGWGMRLRVSLWQLHCFFLLILFPWSSLASPGTAGESVLSHLQVLLIPSFWSHPGAHKAVSHIYFPSVIAPTECFPLPYAHFLQGITTFAEGVSHALWWLCWTWLEPVSSMGQPQMLLTEAALQPPHCQNLGIGTQHRFASKMRVN